MSLFYLRLGFETSNSQSYLFKWLFNHRIELSPPSVFLYVEKFRPYWTFLAPFYFVRLWYWGLRSSFDGSYTNILTAKYERRSKQPNRSLTTTVQMGQGQEFRVKSDYSDLYCRMVLVNVDETTKQVQTIGVKRCDYYLWNIDSTRSQPLFSGPGVRTSNGKRVKVRMGLSLRTFVDGWSPSKTHTVYCPSSSLSSSI